MTLRVEIEKTYGAFHLEVSLQAEGEVLALLGASGCGKSLTLKCIAGIERPDRGRIELGDRVLFDSAAGICLPPQQRRVGYLFQQYALFPHMTAAQNIAAGMGRGFSRQQRQQRAQELMALLRLEGCAGKRPRQLSGGQQQRVALARILASEPEAILLDEPFSALDGYLKGQLELELQDLLDAFPGPAIWVSHDRGEAFRHCARVCLLHEGRSAPVREMRSLLADPITLSAAQLCGCTNFFPVRPGTDPGLVEVTDWNIALRCDAPWRDKVTHLGIPAGRVCIAQPNQVNALPCRVVRRVDDAFSTLLLLQPENAQPGAPLLQMELAPEGCPVPGEAITVALPPQHIFLLEP